MACSQIFGEKVRDCMALVAGSLERSEDVDSEVSEEFLSWHQLGDRRLAEEDAPPLPSSFIVGLEAKLRSMRFGRGGSRV